MKIRREILDAKNFLFIIRYQVLDLGDQVECLPLTIAPERISLQDYTINFNKNTKTVDSVTNKTFGEVAFKAIEVSQQSGGYVFGSTMTIYSTVHLHMDSPKSEEVKMLNIVHVHLNDSSEDVTIDVAYVEKGMKVDDFKEFG